MVNFPNEIFKLVLAFCDDTPIKKHNKKMKKIIDDIDLFTDLYSMILEDFINHTIGEEFNNEVIQDYFNDKLTEPKRLHYFIDYHEFNDERFNYDWDKIDKISSKIIYKHNDDE
jgi:hypothetical protein